MNSAVILEHRTMSHSAVDTLRFVEDGLGFGFFIYTACCAVHMGTPNSAQSERDTRVLTVSACKCINEWFWHSSPSAFHLSISCSDTSYLTSRISCVWKHIDFKEGFTIQYLVENAARPTIGPTSYVYNNIPPTTTTTHFIFNFALSRCSAVSYYHHVKGNREACDNGKMRTRQNNIDCFSIRELVLSQIIYIIIYILLPDDVRISLKAKHLQCILLKYVNLVFFLSIINYYDVNNNTIVIFIHKEHLQSHYKNYY
uniref:Uncharacterized protein n=1 Tax=Glossina brevipalpis TaxID=37001 RepID=A0A1A9WUH8_9MUSC